MEQISILHLPNEILCQILSYLKLAEKFLFSKTCSEFRRFLADIGKREIPSKFFLNSVNLAVYMFEELPDEKWMCLAARYGKLEMLCLLMDKGFALNVDVFSSAVEGRHFDVLEWLQNNGCPWNGEVYDIAHRCGDREVVRWLQDNKYPAPYWVSDFQSDEESCDSSEFDYPDTDFSSDFDWE